MGTIGLLAYVQKHTFRAKIRGRSETTMSPRELIETALRVLAAWTDGRKPASADVEALKRAFPSSAHLLDDDLACQVIHDLSGRALREPTQVVTAPPVMDQVA